MNTYLFVKALHIMSSVLMVGTGFGTAYYLFFTNRIGRVSSIADVARLVVRADWWFTTPAVIFQPLSGIWLAYIAGWPLTTPWLLWSIVLFVLTGACWLPVVWLQLRLAKIARETDERNEALPAIYWRYARYWEWLGYPAFVAMLGVYFLMVMKPDL